MSETVAASDLPLQPSFPLTHLLRLGSFNKFSFYIKVILWSNFFPFDFLGVSQRISWKNKNAVYRLQISALVPEIFKFEKWVKYANEMIDDVIHSTQYQV